MKMLTLQHVINHKTDKKKQWLC